jgi:hypothetical protein
MHFSWVYKITKIVSRVVLGIVKYPGGPGMSRKLMIETKGNVP